MQNEPSVPAAEGVGGDVVFQDKQKKNLGVILGMVFLAILAVGGIGFGVWAMMDGNAQNAKLNEQIADLNRQLAENNEIVVDDVTIMNEESAGGGFRNPIIQSNNADEYYSVSFESSHILAQDYTRRVGIIVQDGKISTCSLYRMMNENTWQIDGPCTINGIEGEIFKVVEFGAGHVNSGNKIGFIMEDGRVAYLNLYDFSSSDSADIIGYLKIEKRVSDIVTIGVGFKDYGGYGSSVFILSDGTFIKYDESVLTQ